MTRLFAPLALALFALTAPAQSQAQSATQADGDHDIHHELEAHDDDDDHDAHISEVDGLRALHGWTRATEDGRALVFVEIENTGNAPVMLLGGEADIAGSVTLVGFQFQDGEPTYVAIPGMPMAAGGEMMLAPNGLSLELGGLSRALVEGEHFEMELEFDVGHLQITVEIESADATQHSHAGHQH